MATLKKRLEQVKDEEAEEFQRDMSQTDPFKVRPGDHIYLRRIIVELRRANILLEELLKGQQ